MLMHVVLPEGEYALPVWLKTIVHTATCLTFSLANIKATVPPPQYRAQVPALALFLLGKIRPDGPTVLDLGPNICLEEDSAQIVMSMSDC